MTLFYVWRAGFLVFWIIGHVFFVASNAVSGQSVEHSRVLLEVDLGDEQFAAREQLRILERLIDRIMTLDHMDLTQGQSATAVVAGQGLEGVYVDVDGLSCQQASRFVEINILQNEKIEIGLEGARPLLRSPDVSRTFRTNEGHLVLLLRKEGAKRFRELTAGHKGESVLITLGEDGRREVVVIRATIDSGQIQVRSENVPDEFALRTVLGYPARVQGCSERE